MMGAVHRLVLDGRAPELAERYAAGDGDLDRTWASFRATLEERLVELRPLVERPVQTNEVGRCAALLPGFLGFAERTGLPLRLLEVGSSAGLNLALERLSLRGRRLRLGAGLLAAADRLRARAAGRCPRSRRRWPSARAATRRRSTRAPRRAGSPCSPTSGPTRRPAWSGCGRRSRSPPSGRPTVERARGGGVDRGSGSPSPPPACATVVYHSIVMQYLSDDEREAFERAVAEAGARASDDAPLAWLRMEPDGERAAIRITTWPGGEERRLARAGYHGTPVVLET